MDPFLPVPTCHGPRFLFELQLERKRDRNFQAKSHIVTNGLNQNIHIVLRLLYVVVFATQPASRISLLAQETTPIIAKDWSLQLVPNAWRSLPKDMLAPIGGFSWYRALVLVPSNWNNDRLSLFVEALDDARATSINGKLVGVTGTFPPRFRSGLGERGRYQIDPAIIQFGEYNAITIRVYQSDSRPNFSVAPPVLLNETKMKAIRLEGAWQYRPGDDGAWSNTKPLDFGLDTNVNLSNSEVASKAVYRRLDDVDDIDRYVARREGDTDPLTPENAEKRFVTPDDLSVQLVLSDPVIAQPLFMTWDERGRMWLAEYRQYPEPAGLTMLSRDVFLRSVYDKVPPPPPNHFKGKDRISIHEDTDGDGVYDLHKTFVDGLSLASSVAVGRGGVYVTNPPYLLYYPDRDGDDVPDRNPDVLLEGFGIEDSHSVINSLRFGPDGWLYGAQGSTVSAAVRKPGSKEPPIRTVGQQIWRFHPESKVFEVYAEGGGNTFGCEIDEKGRVFSGHNGGDTRGFHYVQGGYYRKGFGKHGPLSNPYTFGFFENIKHGNVARFTHNFIIYEEGVLPERYQGRLLGIEPLQGQVVLSDITPWKSSFETKDIERVLKTDDPWFRPVDIKSGPDGCVYIADMYEQRIDHSSHYAGRVDRTNGRIYRLRPKVLADASDKSISQPINYSKFTNEQLIALLFHPSRWHRQTAIRLIGDRSDSSMSCRLDSLLNNSNVQTSLEGVWALQASGGLTATKGMELLNHANPFVRAWTIRILTDSSLVDAQVAREFTNLARHEPSIEVRKQLAASAKRLPIGYVLPIIDRLLDYDGDYEDIHQPLLIWWALEAQVGKVDVSTLIQAILEKKESWNRPLVTKFVLERLMKRFSATGLREDLLSAAKLLSAAPDSSSADILLRGFEEAYQGRSLVSIPDELAAAIASSGGGSLALRLRQGQPDAIVTAIESISQTGAKIEDRRQLIEVLGQMSLPQALPVLLKLLTSEKNMEIVSATLSSLQNYESDSVAEATIQRFNDLTPGSQRVAEAILSSRASWSKLFLRAVESQSIDSHRIATATVRRMLLHSDATIKPLIEKQWGQVADATSAEILTEIARINEVLRTGSGNPTQGKIHFTQQCGRCHRLFEEGGGIGPDLTPFARDNLERMLVSIINPNLEIREGFENYIVMTSDGRVVTGFLADKDEQVVIIRGADGQNVILKKEDIDEMKATPLSVMPEGSLKQLDDQQLRDFFAYLRSSQPVN